MFADNPDVVQMGVPAFLFTGIHGQFGTAADDVQRGTDIMRNGQDNVLRISSNVVFCSIVSSRRFRSFPLIRMSLWMTKYDMKSRKTAERTRLVMMDVERS